MGLKWAMAGPQVGSGPWVLGNGPWAKSNMSQIKSFISVMGLSYLVGFKRAISGLQVGNEWTKSRMKSFQMF